MNFCKLSKIFILSIFFSNLYSQDATINPNFIAVPVLSAAPSCGPRGTKGNMYFNSATNKMFYCNGATWLEMSVTLPFNDSLSNNTQLLKLVNKGDGNSIVGLSRSAISKSAGIVGITEPNGSVLTTYTAGVLGINKGLTNAYWGAGVWGSHEGNGWGVYGHSVSGVGGYFTTGGYPGSIALRSQGALMFSGINAQDGYVLTSTNTFGNAEWRDVANPKIGFSAFLYDQPAIPSSGGRVYYFGELFDDGNYFNDVSSEFTPPSTGIYLLSASIRINTAQFSVNSIFDLDLKIKQDGWTDEKESFLVNKQLLSTVKEHTITKIVKLYAGVPMYIYLTHNYSGGDLNINGGKITLSKIY